jgi:hypothetical protein
MKQLSSFMTLNVNGGDRISFTYDEINNETGELVSSNNKQSFFVVDDELRAHVNAIRAYIVTHKLGE